MFKFCSKILNFLKVPKYLYQRGRGSCQAKTISELAGTADRSSSAVIVSSTPDVFAVELE